MKKGNPRALFVVGLLLGVILPCTLLHHTSPNTQWIRIFISVVGIVCLVVAVVRLRQQRNEA